MDIDINGRMEINGQMDIFINGQMDTDRHKWTDAPETRPFMFSIRISIKTCQTNWKTELRLVNVVNVSPALKTQRD